VNTGATKEQLSVIGLCLLNIKRTARCTSIPCSRRVRGRAVCFYQI